MSSSDEIFGVKKGAGAGGAGLARKREAAEERKTEEERKAHERELAKQEPIQEKKADGNDVVLSNPRWDREKAFFMQEKVKASVDAAIPKSRGDVTKITFNLYAVLHGGKRSDLISSLSGHPDSNGTATVEFKIFHPKNGERRIVKPVESYPYVFTAKHKYSKEISGAELAVVDHAVSTLKLHPENVNLDIPGGHGDLRGSISDYVTFRTDNQGKQVRMGGVSITIEFRNRNQTNREAFVDYNWKQIIETSAPKDGRGNIYEDVLKSELIKNPGKKEIWYGAGQQREYQIPLNNIKDGDYFTDRPGRDFSPEGTVSWFASLSLYGIRNSGEIKKLATIQYGFKLSNEDVIVIPPKMARI
jgi:hypothetical protein